MIEQSAPEALNSTTRSEVQTTIPISKESARHLLPHIDEREELTSVQWQAIPPLWGSGAPLAQWQGINVEGERIISVELGGFVLNRGEFLCSLINALPLGARRETRTHGSRSLVVGGSHNFPILKGRLTLCRWYCYV